MKDIPPSAIIQVTGGTFEDEVSLSLEMRLQSGTKQGFVVDSARAISEHVLADIFVYWWEPIGNSFEVKVRQAIKRVGTSRV